MRGWDVLRTETGNRTHSRCHELNAVFAREIDRGVEELGCSLKDAIGNGAEGDYVVSVGLVQLEDHVQELDGERLEGSGKS